MIEQDLNVSISPQLDEGSDASSRSSDESPSEQPDFLGLNTVRKADLERPPRAPPDDCRQCEHVGVLCHIFEYFLWWPRMFLERLLCGFWRTVW
jgi:hypothetical protein